MATLIREGIRAGVWQGVLDDSDVAEVEVLHHGLPLADVSLTKEGRQQTVQVPIPRELLEDGVQTFVIRDAQRGTTLGHFSIATGGANDDDLRAEVDLLRAELDLLKRAFRRHCLDAG